MLSNMSSFNSKPKREEGFAEIIGKIVAFPMRT